MGRVVTTDPPYRLINPLQALRYLVRGNLHDLFLQEWRRQGDIARFRVGSIRMTVVTDLADVKHVMQDRASAYGKRLDTTEMLLGEGISNSEGTIWRHHRRELKQGFNHRQLARYFPMVQARTRDAVHRLVQASSSTVEEAAVALTRWVIYTALFGAERPEGWRKFLGAFDNLVSHQVWQSALPPILTARAWPWTRAYHSNLAAIDRFVYERIDAGRTDDRTVLGYCLARDASTGEAKFTRREVRDDLVTLLLAGYETTSATICWILLLVGQHPDVARRLLEASSAFPADGSWTLQDLAGFRYGRAVVDEVLRLFPAGWAIRRVALEPDTLPSGLVVREGDLLNISPFLIHRDPQHWSNPDVFDPDRFLDPAAAKNAGYAFIPFGGGPRRCPGMNLAYMEVLTVLLACLQAGTWTVSARAPVAIFSRGTMRPARPVSLSWQQHDPIRMHGRPMHPGGCPVSTAHVHAPCPIGRRVRHP